MRVKAATGAARGRPRKSSVRARTATGGKSDPHLYLQVARVLKDEIVAGVYPMGTQLPTEDDLCTRFSVSRYTVREALRRLRDDHLVSSRQGAGTIVTPRSSSDSYAQDVVSINDLMAFASDAHFAIETIKMVAMDQKLALRTGLPLESEWLMVCGCRQLDDARLPVCWTDYFINRKFAALGRILQRHTGPIFPLIEDMFGQPIVEVQQEISAALISTPLANKLKVKPASATLQVRRAYKLSTAEIAQLTINVFPASRYRHSMTLRRVKA
jgi:GntR family transcriptional regulator